MSNILIRDPLPLMKTAFAVVSGEKSHRNMSCQSQPRANAFSSKGPNPNLKCTNCNKTGHIVDRCFDIIGYPPNYKKPNGQNNDKFVSSNNVVSSNNATSECRPSSSALPILSNEQMQRLMNLLSDKHVQNVHANMAHSGANQHMIVSAKFLINNVYISNLGLTVGYLNEYTVSLLSVHKLARDSKLFVRFDKHKCYIQDLKEKKIVGSDSEESKETDSVATSMEEETHLEGTIP
nr:hypothetical protein [Tanacetum cinerariifolium]